MLPKGSPWCSLPASEPGVCSAQVAIMLPMLLDARPLVRSISCWALSRYSYWIVQASVELNSQGKQQFDTVVAVRLLSLTPALFVLAILPHCSGQGFLGPRGNPHEGVTAAFRDTVS